MANLLIARGFAVQSSYQSNRTSSSICISENATFYPTQRSFAALIKSSPVLQRG